MKVTSTFQQEVQSILAQSRQQLADELHAAIDEALGTKAATATRAIGPRARVAGSLTLRGRKVDVVMPKVTFASSSGIVMKALPGGLSSIVEKTGLDKDDVRRTLRILVEQKKIKMKGKKRGTTYSRA